MMCLIRKGAPVYGVEPRFNHGGGDGSELEPLYGVVAGVEGY